MILGVQINEDSLLITTDKKTWPLTAESHLFYSQIRQLIGDQTNWDEAEKFLDISEHVRKFVDNRLAVEYGIVTFEGRGIGLRMSQYMMRMMDEGFSVEPLIAFLVNLRQNPSARAVNELYTFMDENQLPITPDGHLLAYKFVNDDYTDCHTGKVDNSVGQKPSMPRNEVDDDKERTCSTGYHFCSLEYLKQGWGTRWMVVKVNPRDVVSIPVDYENTKGRCCQYEVIAELERPDYIQENAQHAFDTVVDTKYDNSSMAKAGTEDGQKALANARRAKKAKRDFDKPRYPQSDVYARHFEAALYCKPVMTSDIQEDDLDEDVVEEMEALGHQHGAEDRAKAQRTKKSYASVREYRYPEDATDNEVDTYVDAYEDALAGRVTPEE